MISLHTTFQSKEFSCSIPDVKFAMSLTRAQVKVSVSKNGDSDDIFNEYLYPDNKGIVELTDVDRLIEPFANKWLVFGLSVRIEEQQLSDDGQERILSSDVRTMDCNVVSCRATILNTSATEFCKSHFLTLLDGAKETAVGWTEFLTYIGTDTPRCSAKFDDGQTVSFNVPVVLQTEDYTLINCSPANFISSGKSLVSYTISAGNRRQSFHVNDDVEPDVAPVLLFYNSFGVQELAYCTGEHQQVSSFDRKQGRFGRLKRNYQIEEKETFKADTGYLSFPMANWWREVLRSSSVQLLRVYNGQVVTEFSTPIVITNEKSEISNAPDFIPRFTFEYEYADRNHNVFDTRVEGRVFDNTFDNTFN